MDDWQPYREPLRATLRRTLGIALLAGALIAPWVGGLARWPLVSLLVLWPALGGHWIDLLFLNWLRPHMPPTPSIQRIARLVVWFGSGAVLAMGMRLTARALIERPRMAWLTWTVAGVLFVAIELIAHAGLRARGRPSFYDGLG